MQRDDNKVIEQRKKGDFIMKNLRAKAQVMNLAHEKKLLLGLALLLAFLSVVAFIPSAFAGECKEAKIQAQEEVIIPHPYELKSQKLGH